MMKLAGAGVQSAQDVDVGYGSATLGSQDREALLAGIQEMTPALEIRDSRSRSFGSDPEQLADHVDRDTGVRGQASVFIFPNGGRYESAPTALDESHATDQPEHAAMTGRYSFSSEPGRESSEDSVARVTVIGRNGEVSTRALAA